MICLKNEMKVLQKVNLDEVVSQEPHSYIDEERFAYFYKDTLTSAYNQYYLDFILQKNAGDKFLRDFAEYLQKEFSDFRIYRDWNAL